MTFSILSKMMSIAAFVAVALTNDAVQFIPAIPCAFLIACLLLMLMIYSEQLECFSVFVLSITSSVCLSMFWKNSQLSQIEELSDTDAKIENLGKQKKEAIAVQEKKRKKDKRKKKTRQLEEDKENFPTSLEKSIIYGTLEEFDALAMDKKDLYYYMHNYLLSEEEMKRNRYPVPGMMCSEIFAKEGVVHRKCCRCSKSFFVSLTGTCENVEMCVYHPEKPKSFEGLLYHPCCMKDIGSTGCQTFSTHVCAKPVQPIHFKKVRSKKQVRAEHLCAIYALDCEMVYTNLGFQVAKIGIVDVEGRTIYETFVLPENDVIDYNTRYSGITAKDLKGITTTLTDVQGYLDQLLNQDTILIGHALESDLNTLRLRHDKVIDTAILFPRSNGTKHKLKELAAQYLKKTIQDSPHGHNCIEDARTCMALILYKVKEDRLQNKFHRILPQPFTPFQVYGEQQWVSQVPIIFDNSYFTQPRSKIVYDRKYPQFYHHTSDYITTLLTSHVY